MKQMKTKSIFSRVVTGIVIITLFLGLLPSEAIPKAKAEYYFGGQEEIRVYLSQDDLVTKGHTGDVSISTKKITITGWSYVWGGEFKYGKNGWDGNRGKWIKKKQTYILNGKCKYADVGADYSDLEGGDTITFSKFTKKLKEYKKQKGICVAILKSSDKVGTVAFCKTGKLATTEKLKKEDYGTVNAKGCFECDPENYGQAFMEKGNLVVKGNIVVSAGTLKKETRKYAISSKCEYIYQHKDVSAGKMKKVLADFRKGKYCGVFISFTDNKVTMIEVAARI